MTTATKHITVLAKAPDSRGTFEGTINYNPAEGDKDGERIANWVNLPTTVALGYQHAYGDPEAEIGTAKAMVTDGGRMLVLGRLELDNNPMAQAVYERSCYRAVTRVRCLSCLLGSRSRTQSTSRTRMAWASFPMQPCLRSALSTPARSRPPSRP
jgi:hypothetical protein